MQLWFMQVLRVDEIDQVLKIYCWIEEVGVKGVKGPYSQTFTVLCKLTMDQRALLIARVPS